MVAHYKNTLVIINNIVSKRFYLALANQFIKFLPFIFCCNNCTANNIRTIINHVVENLMKRFDSQPFFYRK